ncbi:hypothetical protein MKW92_052561 [Papaver armeniacum]|nr:hypothetical protein MKW92_052561 [Papaver armeniacum]
MGNPNTNTNYRKKKHHHLLAARTGDINAVQSIIASNPLTVNSRDKHSRTPLHLAAWAGNNEVVSYLCKNKADVRAAAMDDMGAIPLLLKGHLEVVRTLLSSGASVKSCNRRFDTPYLVRKRSSLSTKTKAGKTPLDLTNSEEIRSCLVEKTTRFARNNQNVKEENEEKDPKPSTEENSLQTLEPVVEDAIMQDERQDTETGNEKRKGDEKAKIALNHLVGADDDAQEEENL